jgi:penicillin-binding protein 2
MAIFQSGQFGMFQRRLVLLSIALLLVFAGLLVQLWRLSVVEHADRLERAMGRIKQSEMLPTIRGSIVDRHGRVLAEDAASYDVALHWSAINGEWDLQQATVEAVQAAGGRRAWLKLPLEERDRRKQSALAEWNAVWAEVLGAIVTIGGMPAAERDEAIAAIRDRVNLIQKQKDDRDLSRRVDLYGEEARADFRSETVQEKTQYHAVLRGVDDATAFAFGKLADRAPGAINVLDSRVRRRPHAEAMVELPCDGLPIGMRRYDPLRVSVSEVGSRIVGVTRSHALAEDAQRRPLYRMRDGELIVDLGGYEPGPDVAGATGIERTQDDRLRGKRGRVRTPIGADAPIRDEPVPGDRVQLSIDAALQARIEAILEPAFGLTIVQGFHSAPDQELGTPLAAAAVAIDIDTGEILAMASWPDLDDHDRLSARQRLALKPWMDRAIGASFEPGSVMKPVVVACASAEDVATPSTVIDCTGHFFPGVHGYARCWIYRPDNTPNRHGPLGAAEAIARSCNMFFYTMADRLGPRELMAGYTSWGFGRTLGVGLDYERLSESGGVQRVGESAGSIRQRDLMQIEASKDRQTTISLGIGQGDMRVTPLQVANAYATLARDGVSIRPSVLRGGAGSRVDLGVPDAMMASIKEGLRLSVDAEYGTLHHVGPRDQRAPVFDLPGIRVWGKSGTSETSPLVITHADGTKEVVTSKDHAWAAGFAGARADGTPRVAFCTFVDHGGGGGKTAGPIAAALVRACADEGYLGDGLRSRSTVRFPDAPNASDQLKTLGGAR